MRFSLPRRSAVWSLALILVLGYAERPAHAQAIRDAQGIAPESWPSKPLRIIVGFPGGSSPDLLARTLAEPLAKALGQPVVVENKVGAGGNIAAEAVARATDNHTLGVMINGNLTIAKLINPQLHFDPLKDLRPISLIATAPLALVAPIETAGASPKAFPTAARDSGDRWNYGSPGVGTVAHIGMELVKSKMGSQAVHIPYPGNPQVINALIGGQIQMALLPPAMAAAQARAGKVRVIGVTSGTRSSLVPEFPSLTEAGINGVHLEIWNAVAAPKSLPKATADRLSDLFSRIARSPDIREKLFQQGWQVAGSTSEGLAHRIDDDTRALGNVIRTQGIRAD